MDLAALKAEIDTDPAGLGLAGLTDERVANVLNRVRNQDAGNPLFEVNRKEVSGADIASAMAPSEFAGLSAGLRDYIAMLTNGETLTANRFRSNLLGLFAQGSATRTNLNDVFKRHVSRSQKLFGEDATPSHVADARRLP